MLERLLEPVAFDPSAAATDGALVLDAKAVDAQLKDLVMQLVGPGSYQDRAGAPLHCSIHTGICSTAWKHK